MAQRSATRRKKNSAGKKGGLAQEKRSRQQGVRDFVGDIKTRIHVDAAKVLGGMGKIWPLSVFEDVGGGILALLYVIFDANRSFLASQLEDVWLQLRYNARAITQADLNQAVLIRLAYETYGEDAIRNRWQELHTSIALCDKFLSKLLTEEEKVGLRRDVLGEEPPPSPDVPREDDIPQEVLDAMKEESALIGTEERVQVEHPPEATQFGGES